MEQRRRSTLEEKKKQPDLTQEEDKQTVDPLPTSKKRNSRKVNVKVSINLDKVDDQSERMNSQRSYAPDSHRGILSVRESP